MVCSLDGYIADKNNSVSWFETSEIFDGGVQAESPEEFFNTVDCFVMGSHTYEHAFELSKNYGWPYGSVPTIVLSSRNLPADRDNIEFWLGSLDDLVEKQLKPRFRNVWVAGGAIITGEFIRKKLAHELKVSILPVIIGGGLLFFEHALQRQNIKLIELKAYNNGMVEMSYKFDFSQDSL
ncbi:MAG: dihydrofolate reductase [Bacteroidetes bacterium]|nr:MAG: dihydrofolate reductase [Bacteroidota bacterium]REK05822.1 MAG: dihydrofolate reductase [Bacteroidota bacterium]REK32042.1 MAG: dihydrofolate reductase [Bacteroidota bacterium]REK50107.1 MAG: dihydrofolate reductase [Bacteroidota bacterium]